MKEEILIIYSTFIPRNESRTDDSVQYFNLMLKLILCL